jgi:sulfur carrier protein
MKLSVNGKEVETASDLSLEELLKQYLESGKLDGIAVAVNGEVVPKGLWRDRVLQSDDRLEIIRAVQGG